MTSGSLFAGGGLFDLGFQRAGFRILWQVEIDPFCRKVLAKNFPDVERFEDVRSVGKHNLVPVDVIFGGFPCQDISIAGKGVGIVEGSRSGLWSEQARIISELRPKYVVVENVKQLLKKGMDRVLGDLSQIGYDAEWEVIPAWWFGLPQPRERVYVVAYPSGQRNARLLEGIYLGAAGSRRSSSSADLQDIANAALIGNSCFPQPLLRGMDDRPSDWMDRVKLCGNAVVPQIPEWIARQILKYEGMPE